MQQVRSSIPSWHRWGSWVVFSLAAVLFFWLRASHIQAVTITPPGLIPVIDSKFYLEWATRIQSGLGMGAQAFFMNPLYPIFMAFVGAVTGELQHGTYWTQMFLSFGTMLLLARFTARRFGRLAASFAALLFALYVPAVYYDGMLLTASLILFLTTLILNLIDLTDRLPSWLSFAVAGLAIGLSGIARPNALILVPAFAVVLFFRYRKSSWAKICILGAAAFLAILPVMVHNAAVGGGFTLTTNSAGVNLFIGNNEDGIGLYDEAPWLRSAEPVYESEDYRLEAQRRLGKKLTMTEASRYWRNEALRWSAKHPLDFVKLQAKKFAYFWNNVEAPNNASIYGVRDFSPLLRKFRFFSFGLIAPFGLLGLIAFARRRETAFPAALVIGYLVATMLFFVSSEYRYPVVAVLIPYTIGAIVFFISSFREGHILELLRGLTFLVAALTFVHVPWQMMELARNPRMDYFNWGSVAYADRDYMNASLMYTSALIVDPSWDDAHLQLAFVFDDMGSREMADKEYEAAGMTRKEVAQLRFTDQIQQEILPDSLRIADKQNVQNLVSAAHQYNVMGKHHDAFSLTLQALQMDSTNVDALWEHGFALLNLKRPTLALRNLRKVEKARPDDPFVTLQIAWCYFNMGDSNTGELVLDGMEKIAKGLPDKKNREFWLEKVKETRLRFRNF